MTEEQQRMLEVVKIVLGLLNSYSFEKFLGVGGCGFVIKVRHRVLKERAMKFLHPYFLSQERKDVRERFEKEALIMNQLNHPNIVRLFELGEMGGYPYFIMEYLEGGTLEDHLVKFGSMPPKQAVRVAIAILQGLQAAHEFGTVHRDIKPQNILLDKNGTPKITDFGIAQLKEGNESITRVGTVMGTQAYMSQEQQDGEIGLIDHRCDINAMGVTLYVMLTCGTLGRNVFHEQIANHPERLSSVRDDLQMIIRKATAKNPVHRFESAISMIEALESCLQDIPDDPIWTPVLGTATLVQSEPQIQSAPEPADVIVGSTIVPQNVSSVQASQAQPVRSTATWMSGQDSKSDGSAMKTMLPDDLAQETGEEKAVVADKPVHEPTKTGRVIVPGVAFALVLIFAAGTWVYTHPVSKTSAVPSTQQVVEEPVVQEPKALEPQVLTKQEPETKVLVVKDPTPAKARPKPVETPKAAKVTISESPSTAMAIEKTAQVRLILRPETVATVTLTGERGTYTLTGGSREVPQGMYRASVEMPGIDTPQVGSLMVTPGLTVITCDSRFKRCSGLK